MVQGPRAAAMFSDIMLPLPSEEILTLMALFFVSQLDIFLAILLDLTDLTNLKVDPYSSFVGGNYLMKYTHSNNCQSS